MDPLNLLKAFFKQSDPVPSELTVLRPGQIVRGRILRFFSDNTAEIQIGAQKLVAKLEVSLAMGQSYLFQVQPGKGKSASSLSKEMEPRSLLLIINLEIIPRRFKPPSSLMINLLPSFRSKWEPTPLI